MVSRDIYSVDKINIDRSNTYNYKSAAIQNLRALLLLKKTVNSVFQLDIWISSKELL